MTEKLLELQSYASKRFTNRYIKLHCYAFPYNKTIKQIDKVLYFSLENSTKKQQIVRFFLLIVGRISMMSASSSFITFNYSLKIELNNQ